MGNAPEDGSVKTLTLLTKNKADANAENFEEMLKIARGDGNGENVKIGVLMKEFKNNDDAKEGSNLAGWEGKLKDDASKTEMVDITGGISLVMAVKDKEELDLLKKSSVLSNKVLKHGCIPKLEAVIEGGKTITHEKLASEVNEIIEDPSKIKLNVPKDQVEDCYFPIIQSGGEYDFKVSAESNEENLKYDIITVSLGARYNQYCSNIVRTFLIDVPEKVKKMYRTLLGMHEACLAAMVPGKPLKWVYASAVKYLRDQGKEDLIAALPKTLGFAVGLDFRDTNLLLNSKNTVTFRPGMVFNLAVSFSGLKLSDSVRASIKEGCAVSISI